MLLLAVQCGIMLRIYMKLQTRCYVSQCIQLFAQVAVSARDRSKLLTEASF